MSISSKLMKSQLIGLELEIYSKLSIRDTNTRIAEMGISGFEVVSDASLYDHYDENDDNRYGAEIRLSSPIHISTAYQKLYDLYRIATDSEIDARFNDDDSIRGTTGLHVHFGLSSQYKHNILDMLRLLKNVRNNESKIEELGARKCNRWARSMEPVVQDVRNAINSISSSRRKFVSVEEKLDYIVTNSYINRQSLIERILNYESEYFNYRSCGKRLTFLIKSLLNNPIIGQADSRWLDGEDSNIRITKFPRTSSYERRDGDISIKTDFRTNDKIVLRFELVDEDSSDTIKYSDFSLHYSGLLSKATPDRNDGNKMRILFNKYINIADEVDTLLMYMFPMLDLPHEWLFFSNQYDMEAIRIYYDYRNQHSDRATRRALEVPGIRADINARFNQTYTPTTVSKLNTNWFNDLYGYHYDDNRYYGANATNIGDYYSDGRTKKINTIEFRWASSTISDDIDSLIGYFNFLKDIFFDSFTGENEMKWEHFTLRDITDQSKDTSGSAHQIAVYDSANMLSGRVKCDNLSNKIRHSYKGAIDSQLIAYNDPRTSNSRKLSIRREILQILEHNNLRKHKVAETLRKLKTAGNVVKYNKAIELSKDRNFDEIYSLSS